MGGVYLHFLLIFVFCQISSQLQTPNVTHVCRTAGVDLRLHAKKMQLYGAVRSNKRSRLLHAVNSCSHPSTKLKLGILQGGANEINLPLPTLPTNLQLGSLCCKVRPVPPTKKKNSVKSLSTQFKPQQSVSTADSPKTTGRIAPIGHDHKQPSRKPSARKSVRSSSLKPRASKPLQQHEATRHKPGRHTSTSTPGRTADSAIKTSRRSPTEVRNSRSSLKLSGAQYFSSSTKNHPHHDSKAEPSAVVEQKSAQHVQGRKTKLGRPAKLNVVSHSTHRKDSSSVVKRNTGSARADRKLHKQKAREQHLLQPTTATTGKRWNKWEVEEVIERKKKLQPSKKLKRVTTAHTTNKIVELEVDEQDTKMQTVGKRWNKWEVEEVLENPRRQTSTKHTPHTQRPSTITANVKPKHKQLAVVDSDDADADQDDQDADDNTGDDDDADGDDDDEADGDDDDEADGGDDDDADGGDDDDDDDDDDDSDGDDTNNGDDEDGDNNGGADDDDDETLIDIEVDIFVAGDSSGAPAELIAACNNGVAQFFDRPLNTVSNSDVFFLPNEPNNKRIRMKVQTKLQLLQQQGTLQIRTVVTGIPQTQGEAGLASWNNLAQNNQVPPEISSQPGLQQASLGEGALSNTLPDPTPAPSTPPAPSAGPTTVGAPSAAPSTGGGTGTPPAVLPPANPSTPGGTGNPSSTNPVTPTSGGGEDGGDNSGVIGGIIGGIGVLLVVVIGGVVAFFIWRSKSKSNNHMYTKDYQLPPGDGVDFASAPFGIGNGEGDALMGAGAPPNTPATSPVPDTNPV